MQWVGKCTILLMVQDPLSITHLLWIMYCKATVSRPFLNCCGLCDEMLWEDVVTISQKTDCFIWQEGAKSGYRCCFWMRPKLSFCIRISHKLLSLCNVTHKWQTLLGVRDNTFSKVTAWEEFCVVFSLCVDQQVPHYCIKVGQIFSNAFPGWLCDLSNYLWESVAFGGPFMFIISGLISTQMLSLQIWANSLCLAGGCLSLPTSTQTLNFSFPPPFIIVCTV